MVSTCGLCQQPPFEGWDILGTSVCEQQAGRDIPCNAGPLPDPKAPIHRPCKFCHLGLNRWFHRPCFEILRASYGKSGRPSLGLIADTTKIIDSLLPAYVPAAVKRKADIASTLDGLFSPLTKDILASVFSQQLLAKFPPEILDLILEFSGPCWYLIVLGEVRRLIEYKRECDLNSWSSIPLPVISAAVSRRIYVSRVTVQGTRYIGRISSEPLPAHFSSPPREDQEYYDPPDDFDRLLLIADGVAARDIKLLRKGEDIPREKAEGLWYNVVNISELTGTTILRVEDGLVCGRAFLLLGIIAESPEDRKPDTPAPSIRLWSDPNHPQQLQLWNGVHASAASQRTRLDYINLKPSNPDSSNRTRGLVVYAARWSITGIHAFRGKTAEFDAFMETMKQRAEYSDESLWQYFPLGPQEQICDAWLCFPRSLTGHRSIDRPRAFAIKTTHNRSASFGTFFDPGKTQIWHLINPSDGGSDSSSSSSPPHNFITGLFHSTPDPTDPCVSHLGVTCAHNTIPPPNAIDEPAAGRGFKSGSPGCPPYDLPYSNMWSVAVLDDAQLTRARARNITRVTLCQESEGPITVMNSEGPRSLPRVWGMLLTYSDGREEALGQFRWDFDTSVSFRGGPECVLVERREYRSQVRGHWSHPRASLVEYVVGVLSGERARRLGFVGEMEGELGKGEAEGYSWRRSWRTIRDRSEGGREHILWWIVKEEDVIEFV
ncbi:hypothetical protein FQN51_002565 [Onygenales sp. PD_10]|nr:hypothetical protein FQN51_002565 [Onygenales sp. PD_10]